MDYWWAHRPARRSANYASPIVTSVPRYLIPPDWFAGLPGDSNLWKRHSCIIYEGEEKKRSKSNGRTWRQYRTRARELRSNRVPFFRKRRSIFRTISELRIGFSRRCTGVWATRSECCSLIINTICMQNPWRNASREKRCERERNLLFRAGEYVCTYIHTSPRECHEYSFSRVIASDINILFATNLQAYEVCRRER